VSKKCGQEFDQLCDVGYDWGEKKESSRGGGRSDQKFPKWMKGGEEELFVNFFLIFNQCYLAFFI